jgi:hypothetical protein
METVKDNLRKQSGPRIPFEKKRIEDLRYGNLPTDSVLLYEDEKGPIVAKTYGGTSVIHTVQGIQGPEDKGNP